MSRTPLLPKLSIAYNPRTSGKRDPLKKEELKEKVFDALKKSNIDLEKLRADCLSSQYLSLDVTYRLYSNSTVEGRSKKDLDNMLKILIDILPEKMSVQDGKGRKGLGLIADDKDDKIFEIHCAKKKVYDETKEGMDIQISRLDESDVNDE